MLITKEHLNCSNQYEGTTILLNDNIIIAEGVTKIVFPAHVLCGGYFYAPHDVDVVFDRGALIYKWLFVKGSIYSSLGLITGDEIGAEDIFTERTIDCGRFIHCQDVIQSNEAIIAKEGLHTTLAIAGWSIMTEEAILAESLIAGESIRAGTTISCNNLDCAGIVQTGVSLKYNMDVISEAREVVVIDADGSVAEPIVESLQGVRLTAISTRFPAIAHCQSLGSNCEFGLYQKTNNQSTITDLCKFCSIGFNDLVNLVKDKASGVGEPAQTKIYRHGKEFNVEDTIYGLITHYPNVKDAQLKAINHVKFLATKFAEDLDRGGKLYVYVDLDGQCNEDAALLHKTLIKHNSNNRLLFVRRAAWYGAEPNSVYELDKGLYLGYITSFAQDGYRFTGEWTVDVDSWTEMLSHISF